MKTLFQFTVLLISASLVFSACQKELSNEKGASESSKGSLLKDGAGNCQAAVVSGLYYKDTTLKSSNYVDVQVQVDSAGSYEISTDIVNGYSFNATGTFGTTGVQTVRLTGSGKPINTGSNIFTVTYNGTTCYFTVTVTAATGGSAVFTVNCAIPPGVINGTYQAGAALNTGNTVVLSVNVTTIGTWSVSTAPAVNGMTFSGSGSFTATGAQTITLNGSGTPTAAGTFNFPITVGGSTCNFSVTVTGIPDYFPRTTFSNWSYEIDDVATDSLLYVVSPQTHSAGGNTYNIFFLTDDASLGFDTAGYYRRAGSDYYEWGDISWGILDNPFRSEYIFLKDNQTVGATWQSSSFSGNYTPTGGATISITLRWNFTVVQQNATVTVNGTNYANTIQVKQEMQLQSGSNWITQFYLQNYYARDKGLIKQDIYAYDVNSNSYPLLTSMEVRRLVIY